MTWENKHRHMENLQTLHWKTWALGILTSEQLCNSLEKVGYFLSIHAGRLQNTEHGLTKIHLPSQCNFFALYHKCYQEHSNVIGVDIIPKMGLNLFLLITFPVKYKQIGLTSDLAVSLYIRIMAIKAIFSVYLYLSKCAHTLLKITGRETMNRTFQRFLNPPLSCSTKSFCSY